MIWPRKRFVVAPSLSREAALLRCFECFDCSCSPTRINACALSSNAAPTRAACFYGLMRIKLCIRLLEWLSRSAGDPSCHPLWLQVLDRPANSLILMLAGVLSAWTGDVTSSVIRRPC